MVRCSLQTRRKDERRRWRHAQTLSYRMWSNDDGDGVRSAADDEAARREDAAMRRTYRVGSSGRPGRRWRVEAGLTGLEWFPLRQRLSGDEKQLAGPLYSWQTYCYQYSKRMDRKRERWYLEKWRMNMFFVSVLCFCFVMTKALFFLYLLNKAQFIVRFWDESFQLHNRKIIFVFNGEEATLQANSMTLLLLW